MESLDKDKIRQTLHETICKVTFTKLNGDERVMYCTLNEEMIPNSDETNAETKQTKKENPGVQPVYDVKAPGWRSFRWDSVKNFTSEFNA